VIQIEKFAPNQAANSGEFLDHHTRESRQVMEATTFAGLPFFRTAAQSAGEDAPQQTWVNRPDTVVLLVRPRGRG
jgi:hypothetical protein